MATAPTNSTVALSAAGFVDSIGVNIHLPYDWTSYGNLSVVENSLAYLGVSNVRDSLVPWSQTQPAYQELMTLGYKFDFIIPIASIDIPGFVSLVDSYATSNPGSVLAVEGPNEVNLWPVTYNGGSGLANAAQYQHAFYDAVRADPHLNSIPVYNLSLGSSDPSLFQQLGDLSSAANFANSHAYLRDNVAPAYTENVLFPLPKIDTPGLPTVITETGYTTNPYVAYNGIDETGQAKYTLDTLMDAYKAGVAKTFLYELLDQYSDPTFTSAEDHYGLFNSDGTPKLAATAIHDLTTILADPSASPSFTPGSLSYTVTNLTAPYGNQALLEKANGTFDLVLWAEPIIWNSSNQTDIAAPDDITTVTFSQVEGTIFVFDPLLGSTPIATYNNVQQIKVDITDHPIIIEVGSTGQTITVPVPPVIVDFSPNSNIVSDSITNASILTLTGTAEANNVVAVFDGTKQIGTATANANGTWSLTTGTLASASHSFTAKATDVAGNTSAASAALNVTVDAVAPSAPAISSVSPDSGKVGDGITNVTVLTLAGTAEVNSVVAVFDGTKQIGTATANASGAWSLTTGTLASAGHSFTAKATDAAGNVSAASAALNVTVDAVAPSAPAISSVSPDSGKVGDGITNVTVLTLAGTAEANSVVAVFDGTKQIGTATANANGTWSLTTGTLASASHSFTAKATDVAGNTSVASAALNVTVDAVAPSAPVIASDTTVNTDEVLLTGSAEANSLVTLFDGTTQLGTVTANGSGAWSYTTGHLLNGDHVFTATAMDAAGNTSLASPPVDPTISTAAPAVPHITSFSPDSAKVGDGITNANVLTLTGNADAGSTVKIFDGTTMLGTAAVNASGIWNFANTKMADGSHSFTATDTNAAGNTSAASTSLNVTVDTHAPTPAFTNLVHNSNGTVTLSGTSDANSVLSIYDGTNTSPLGTATANANGTWSFTTSKPSNTVHSFTLKAMDVAGNVGSGSGAAVYGSTNSDILKVGPGNDLVMGHGGNDTFVFGTSFGKDVITDFRAGNWDHDTLQFSHNTFSNFAAVLAHAAQVGSDVVITADAVDTVTLKNVHLSSLQKNDIHIV